MKKPKIISGSRILLLRKIKLLIENIIFKIFSILFKVHKKDNLGIIISEAFHSPWLNDKNFLKIYSSVKKLTMLNDQRLYCLMVSLKNLSHVKGEVVEIGCWRGGSSILLAKTLNQKKMIKNVHSFDTFEGVVKSSKYDLYYKDGYHSDSNYEQFKKFIRKFKLSNLFVYKKVFPDELNTFEKNKIKSICFCHIDVDTYYSCKDCLNFIWPRLSKGGIIILDDYGFHQTTGVRKAVHEFIRIKHLSFFYNLTGQAIIIKTIND